MKFAFTVVLSAVASVLAQGSVTVNTPIGPISCLNQQVTFSGGTPPYVLQVVRFGDTSGSTLNTYTDIQGSPYQWFVEQPAGTSVFLRIRDANGNTNESGQINIQPGGPATCTPPTSTSGGDEPTSSGPATPPGETSAPPPSGSSSNPPAPGSPSSSGTTPRSSSTTPVESSGATGGDLSLKVAGGAIFGAAGLVAAILA